MKALFTFLASALLITQSTIAATCNSLGTGDWNTPSTWSCGTVPTGSSTVTIKAGDTVSISTVTNVIGAAMTITINGVLLFDSPSSQLNLPCNTVIVISATGSIESSGPGAVNQAVRICRANIWLGTDGPLTGPLIIGIILPIELTFFDAESNGSQIDFTWQTATEMNNDFFTIEGSSDGLNWNKMELIDGAGTTQEIQNYSFTSGNLLRYEYFRLKQTDFDGMFSYSDIVAVPLVRDELIVYPNPSNGNELTINLSSNDPGTLQILGSDGRVAYSAGFEGEKILNLNDLNLRTGAYIVQIQQSNDAQVERLIVR